MLMVLGFFGYFSVCLINSTYGIINYTHNNMLGSTQMKSSTSIFFVYFPCAWLTLCIRFKNLSKNRIMGRSENVKYL